MNKAVFMIPVAGLFCVGCGTGLDTFVAGTGSSPIPLPLYQRDLLSTGGLLGYWRLTEAAGATTVTDLTGLGNFGVGQVQVSGAYTMGFGIVGPLFSNPDAGMGFTGDPSGPNQGAHVAFPSGYNFGAGSAPLSVETWFKYSSCATSGNSAWIYIYGTTPSNNYIRLGCTTGAIVEWEARDSASNGITMQLTAPTFGVWHHIVATKSTSTIVTNALKIYLDGVIVAASPVVPSGSYSNGGGVLKTALSLNFGMNANLVTFTPVQLSQVAIYNTELPAATITRHYNIGTTGAP